MISEIDKYWVGREIDITYHCPNVSLFRLVGNFFGSMENISVLEIGCGHGADLMECQRRKANVYGLDLNPNFVKNLQHKVNADIRIFKAGADSIPFPVQFDLIYSRDTINYLENSELEQLFSECFRCISDEGVLIFQFIEADMISYDQRQKNLLNFNPSFLDHHVIEPFHEPDNPIRLIHTEEVVELARLAGFEIVGTKTMTQSYDLLEQKVRIDKYMVFRKSKQ